jgi:hypothetical protein
MQRTLVRVACAALGGISVGACTGLASSTDDTFGNIDSGAPPDGRDSGIHEAGAVDARGGPGSACVACVTDADCGGKDVCAQFGGDSYCAPTCAAGAGCSPDTACVTETTVSGQQVDVCVPRGNVCGASPGPAQDGGPPPLGADSGGPSCGPLAPPATPAGCSSCKASSSCQANGCYGGWYCNAQTDKCQPPPAGCSGGGSDAGAAPEAGPGGAADAGPVTGTVGAGGGTVSSLYFVVVGDTRPAGINDTAGYPTAIITKIYQDIESLGSVPLFGVSTGDYMFASTSSGQAAPQLDLYLHARAGYSGIMFPTMGNHECTGATASNCGAGNADGVTDNYTQYMSKMIAPLGQSRPYYAININSASGAWTAKFVFVAANAWDSNQAAWLHSALAQPTTYTFLVRHESRSASTAPGVSPAEQIMAGYPYTLSIVGHSHTYSKSGPKEVIIGNGGAPLTSSGANYGFGLVQQRADGAVQVDMIDYSTMQPDTSFRFAVHPDGTPAP